MEQEANRLGLGNISEVDGVVRILVQGSDFYGELYNAMASMEQHDFRAAGAELAGVLKELNTWTHGHLCETNVCYVLSGVMQYLGSVQDDAKASKMDALDAWRGLENAYKDLSHEKKGWFG